MDQKRIAMVIDSWDSAWGGGQVHVWHLCHGLTEKGLFVDLFTRLIPGPESERRESPIQNWQIHRIGPSFSFFHPIGRVITLFTLALAITRAHREHPYSLIHAHAYLGVISAYIAGKIARRPLIITLHGTHLSDQKKWGPLALIERFIVSSIPASRRITVTRKYFFDHPTKKNVVWIPNGVDTKLFHPKKQSRKPRGAVRFIFVGRLDRVKGIDYLIEACSRLTFPYTLTIVGSGSEKEMLTKQVDTLKLQNEVRFVATQSPRQVSWWYRACDIFVLPSRSEGMPLTILEAMASGLPVVSTPVGELPSLVSKDNGWLAPSVSARGLYQSLLLAQQNKDKWLAIGRRNRDKVDKTYSWSQMVNTVLILYKELEKQ